MTITLLRQTRGVERPGAVLARHAAWALMFVALGMWVVPQFLPAVELGLIGAVPGFTATLSAWSLGEGWGFLAWSANLWFFGALLAWYRHWLGFAWTLALAGVICSGVGVYVFATGWPYLLTDYPPGVGAFVWIGAAVVELVAVSLRLWAGEPAREPRLS